MVEGSEHSENTETILNNFQKQMRMDDKPSTSFHNGTLPHSGK